MEVRGRAEVRAADKNIATLASNGLYRADHHLAIEQGRATAGRDPQEVVAAHVRRLEALRRAGVVERVADGLCKVPNDLTERGRQYDALRLGGVAVELKSHLPIERQARVIKATWLNQQLIGGGRGLGDLGFGGDAKEALQQRADFLEEQEVYQLLKWWSLKFGVVAAVHQRASLRVPLKSEPGLPDQPLGIEVELFKFEPNFFKFEKQVLAFND